MKENGEIPKTRNSFETFQFLEAEGYRVHAALGYQALAMRANNTTLAESYFGHALEALTVEDHIASEAGPIPHSAAVAARALLNLTPITRELVVNKRISEPEAVGEVYGPFVRDLGKQARAAKKFMLSPQKAGSPLFEKQAELIAGLNSFAVLGLLMHEQAANLKENNWMALPAFLEPELVNLDNKQPIQGRWDISVFSGPSNTDFDLIYKIYVRMGQTSHRQVFTDSQTSIVWIREDLKLFGDIDPGIEFDIIKDLQSQTNRGRERRNERTWRLLQKIDERTLDSLKKNGELSPRASYLLTRHRLRAN